MISRTPHVRNANPIRTRFSRFGRNTVQAMLVVLVLTAALSGSLRDCFSQNGHHAIELVHGEKADHLKQYTRTFRKAFIVGETIHVDQPDCIDRLILSETVRPLSPATAFKAPRLRHVSFADIGLEHSWRAGRLRPCFPSYASISKTVRDPALAVLRTTVMLN